ncbi:hypothetical protein MKX01_037046 [Papaver californicum]|nr:hypothetical protein MKX01_037046 [Papaver californicum]
MGAIGGDHEVSSAHEERILVSVRLRPLNEKEIGRNDVSDWECISDNTVVFRSNLPEKSMFPTAYSFDKVFRHDCNTRRVYEEAAKEVSLSVISGINSSIFAYGQTSSGKTYTMTGVTEYALADIYDYIQRRGTVVDKLTEKTLRDWSHVQELLSACEGNHDQPMSCFYLMVPYSNISPWEFLARHNSSTLVASVDFVDLAGSERASQALSAGARLKEGCHINRSLLTLGTVVRKLSKGRNGHFPYRDSKLTRILQCSLGGTISPARTHMEQSRPFYLLVVNVVMSDKVLVKQLQKKLARLESELKAPPPKSSAPDAAAILREKDLQIEKMHKEIQELIHQRDLAQSRLRDLAQVVEDDQASKFSAEHQRPKSPALHAWEDDQSISASSSIADQHCIDASFTSYNNATWYSNARSESSSDEQYQQLPENQDDHYLSDGFLPDIRSVFEDIREDIEEEEKGEEEEEEEEDGEEEENEELCKEVRCIEIEESRTNSKILSSDLSTEEHEDGGQLEPLAVTENEYAKDQELLSTPKKGDEELAQADSAVTCSALEQKLQDVQKSIDCLVNPVSSDESASPWTSAAGSSCARKSFQLMRSRKQYERTLYTYEKCYTGTPEVFQTNYSPSNFGADIKKLTRENSQTSEQSASTDDLKPPSVKTSDKEDITSIQTFVADLKEMAKLEYEKQLIDDQSVKDVGIEPIQESPESPSKWPLEFERKQREIIELWQFCCISLVHRTYFFLLFKGDSSDSIYLEVELRRLSFLKDNFSRGNFHKVSAGADQDLSLASRFSEEERANLYREWGIGLDTKQRRVQLARLLWSDTKDMNLIKERMFGLSFTPRHPSQQRSYSWRRMSSLI